MSKRYELAGEIAAALTAGERSLNQAGIDLFALGQKLFEVRNSGEVHPLEGQREVERLGTAATNLVNAIGDVARVHDRFWAKAKRDFPEVGTGNLCPWPVEGDEPHGNHSNVVEIAAAAA